MAKKLPKRSKPAPSEAGDAQPRQPEGETKIKAGDIQGLKFFKKVRPLLETLHGIGAARDKSDNRQLHMDQYGVLVLMWLFNPILCSLRGLQQASELAAVQKKFGVGRAS